MKDSKGITMASLVVMIASIILLSTMAISFGYRYLTETKKADEKYFKEVLSSAVTKRENNHTVNSPEYPRVGYQITDANSFQEILNKYVPSIKDNGEILFDRGLWYIVDTKVAEKLGVKGSSDYIDVFDKESDESAKVALVDYYTGAVFLIDINDVQGITGISGDVDIIPDDGHIHNFNIPEATCTQDKKCLICGYVAQAALGHLYEGKAYEPIDDEFHYSKDCKRCGMKGGYERHTDLNNYSFYKSGDGEWYHYSGCSKCGWPTDGRNYEKCTTQWKSISDTEHVKECKVCKHSETSLHECEYICIDDHYHEYVCKICGYKKIKYELHEDDGTHKCKKCGCEIATGEEPLLESVILKNKEWPDSHFVTDGETIQLIIKADRMISNVEATICGYGGDKIKYKYSDDKLTCTAELFVDEDVVIAQNTKVTFSVSCKSVSSDKWMTAPASTTTEEGSYLIYDSIPPLVDYIPKAEY